MARDGFDDPDDCLSAISIGTLLYVEFFINELIYAHEFLCTIIPCFVRELGIEACDILAEVHEIVLEWCLNRF